MANRTYPRKDNEYPEVMSKMDPLIIRVDPLVMVVGSTTYTAKVKIGYKFNGFLVHVSGVGIPIYKEEVDITGYNTGKTTTGEGSDAYKYVQDKARDWMDTLEKSMLDDNKEKNIVDLLREIKYQMHFDLSGHKASATVEGSPDYDPRIEVCNDVPTYIEDLYAMLLKISIRLDNLTAVINGGDLKELKNDSVIYNQADGKFDYEKITVQPNVNGLNQLIEGLNTRIGDTSDGTVISKLTTIGDNVGTVANKVDTVANKVDLVASNSTTNATTISNAITNGLNQLVAKMNDMNGKIGMPNDSWQSNTLFGKIDITNTRIGNPTEGGGPDITSRLSTISTNVSTVSTNVSGLPTFINNYSSTLSHLNSALHEGNCGANYEWQSDRGFSSISGPGWGISVHVSN